MYQVLITFHKKTTPNPNPQEAERERQLQKEREREEAERERERLKEERREERIIKRLEDDLYEMPIEVELIDVSPEKIREDILKAGRSDFDI